MTDSDSAVVVLDAADNVGVARRGLRCGETIEGAEVRDDIPKGHKVALASVSAGQAVKKFGQPIGEAAQDIQAGRHIHTHNLACRGGRRGHQFCAGKQAPNLLPEAERETFMGFRRPDGRAGTRNYVGVLSSVNCSATAARMVAAHFTPEKLSAFPNVDGVAAFVHGGGCGMDAEGEGAANLRRVMSGYAKHPNLAAALLLGLGCEVNQVEFFARKSETPNPLARKTMSIQACGGLRKTIAAGIRAVEEMLPAANELRREKISASELTLALQCGGSDAWSGVTANPALGRAADLLVANGGTAVLAETPEIYGAEHLLTRRADDEETGRKLVARIQWWEDYVARNKGAMDNNPSPGNKLGGLTTILEKSLGAVAKGGGTNLNGVYLYAEAPERRGLVVMDSPGYDPASVTGEIASGCNLVAFTTGRGSAFGSKPAPCLKIASNGDIARRMPEDMDINAGRILDEGARVGDIGAEIFRKLLAVASGEKTLSEAQGLGDYEFVPWHIGATM